MYQNENILWQIQSLNGGKGEKGLLGWEVAFANVYVYFGGSSFFYTFTICWMVGDFQVRGTL